MSNSPEFLTYLWKTLFEVFHSANNQNEYTEMCRTGSYLSLTWSCKLKQHGEVADSLSLYGGAEH